MTRNGALAGMVAGATTVILWKELVVAGGHSSLYEIVPGFIAAAIAIVVVSRFGVGPSEAMRERHDGVRETLRAVGY
jgi:sodium/proline symporter